MKDPKDSLKHQSSRNKPPTDRRRWFVFVAVLVSLITARTVFAPSDYALCSRSNDIYTVDETRPRVECIVVRGSRILDTGDQGQCICRFLSLYFILFLFD